MRPQRRLVYGACQSALSLAASCGCKSPARAARSRSCWPRPRGFCAGVGPRHPDRRAGDREVRRAGLCAPRDRPQPPCGRPPEGAGRGVRRGAGRVPDGPAGGVLRPRGAQVGAGRGAGAADALPRRHLPAGLQGARRGPAPPRRRPRDRADRPRRPPRGGRHHGPAAGRRGDPDRDGRGRPRVPARATRPTWPSSPRPRCRWTTPPRSSACLRARFPAIAAPHKEDICYATTNRQEAVKPVAERSDVLLVLGSRQLLELGAPGGGRPCARAPRRLSDRRRRARWTAPGWTASTAVGVTAGASAPEVLVQGVIDRPGRSAST